MTAPRRFPPPWSIAGHATERLSDLVFSSLGPAGLNHRAVRVIHSGNGVRLAWSMSAVVGRAFFDAIREAEGMENRLPATGRVLRNRAHVGLDLRFAFSLGRHPSLCDQASRRRGNSVGQGNSR
jgi:hypothetical protein